MKFDVKILDTHLHDQLPQYAATGSAGPDLCTCIGAPLIIGPDTTHLVPAGMAIHLANPGYTVLILPRSGMGHKHDVVLGNLVGLIDSDCQDQLMINTWNRGGTAFVLDPMKRLAQPVTVPAVQAELNIVDDFVENEHGAGGLGSTGCH